MIDQGEWEEAHRELVRLAAARAEHEHVLGGALLRALRAEVWRAMAMASFIEYAERVVGLTPRQTEDRLRVALALEGLPRTSAALAEGRIHFTAVRELTRVAAPETETAWLEAAEGKTVGEIEKLVAGRRAGDHILLRSEGGTHDDDFLVLLCAFHHRAAHRGALLVEGSWSLGLTFRHADGSTYGAPVNPRAAVVLLRTFWVLFF